ncbi:MAG: sensor domain-containing diguanylate cyclase [Zetaproteobacteria bacterium]|nr:sensor domain-containing diguanylate cyclase [Zetaproteobacteria bacterium]
MSEQARNAVVEDLNVRRVKKLEQENAELKSYVATVMQRLNDNETLFTKLFDLEAQVLMAVDSEALCFTLLRVLKNKFELDMVRLWFDRSSFMGQCRLSALSERDLEWVGQGEIVNMGLADKKVWLLRLQSVSDFPWLKLEDESLASMALLVLGRGSRPFGVLGLGSRDGGRFQPKQSTDFLQHLTQIVSLTLENAFTRDRLAMLSVTDSLTGMNNRRFFQPHSHQHVSQWFGKNVCVACIYFDIDGFKQINDALGHAAGDDILMQVTQKTKACIRSQDTLIRMVGDEFVVFLPACSCDKAIEIAQRMVKSCAALLSDSHQLGISVGVSFSAPEADKVVKSLVKEADRAMYIAKALGGRRVELAPQKG